MAKTSRWLVVCLVLCATGCLPEIDDRPELPTAMPGNVVVINARAGTPASRENRTQVSDGPTSTPAPWATPLPPTPRPKARPLSHDLKGKADCLYCHKGPTYYRVPADHATRKNEMCLGCHSTASGPPPPAPHPKAGREACLVCHLTGKNKARPVPTDHGGRLNDTCAGCHAIK
ncbi:MAG: hypothetical protein HY868_21465 [Chloroflexi bacterium]|nr:hypothetical protein [Chloroflexota bacterium]